MTIAIVIGTHGWAAEQLLKTAEMLLGEQENVGWIDFVPGENAETLIEKYNAQLAKLDTSKGVLFLVDTWGGSPFNAASRIVVDKERYEVIAGVNIPMLVETFMARDDDPSFDELVALAVETGREGVKALKAKPVEKKRVIRRAFHTCQWADYFRYSPLRSASMRLSSGGCVINSSLNDFDLPLIQNAIMLVASCGS